MRKKFRSFTLFCGAFSSHGFLLGSSGKLFGFGENDKYQLGIPGDHKNREFPTYIKFFTPSKSRRVSHLSCGGDYTMFVLSTGGVLGAGNTRVGKMGVGYIEDMQEKSTYDDAVGSVHQPTKADTSLSSTRIMKVFAGTNSSFVLSASGNVFGAGDNENFALGVKFDSSKSVRYNFEKVLLPENVVVKQVAPGAHFTFFVSVEGVVFGAGKILDIYIGGRGYYGEGFKCPLRLNGSLDVRGQGRFGSLESAGSIKSVHCGTDHCVFLGENGRVHVCGDNDWGECGISMRVHRGDDEIYPPKMHPKLQNIVGASCGWCHSLFLRADGVVFACGFGRYGQLGDNVKTYRQMKTSGEFKCIKVEIPEKVAIIRGGFYHSLFITADFKFYGCGRNKGGVLMRYEVERYDSMDVSLQRISKGEATLMKLDKEYYASTGRRERFQFIITKMKILKYEGCESKLLKHLLIYRVQMKKRQNKSIIE